MSGHIWVHAQQPFAAAHYDLVVVGAGRMGASVARFLRETCPGLSLLLAEEGGLPNEEGASILAPGVWYQDVPEAQRERAERTRALLGELLNACGVLTLRPEAAPGFVPTLQLWTPDLEGLIDPAELPYARPDERGGSYSAGGLALHSANTAIAAGADLMLNVRVELAGTASDGKALLKLHRLSVTNMHEVVVGETVNITAGRVIVAAGAAGPHLAETGLGMVGKHRQVYRQSPRLNWPSSDASRVLRVLRAHEVVQAQEVAGFTLRPQTGGYLAVPPTPHPDPWEYQPSGGRLMGVPVGLRREVLGALLESLEALPALGTQALVLGRSIADIPGAWVALPEGGWPLWERLDERHWLLLGGPNADLTGLAVAQELAEELSRSS